MNIFGFEISKKKAPETQEQFPFELVWYGGGMTMIPANITAFIRDGFNGNSTVHHIVKTQSDKFSQIPFRIYKKKGAVQKYLKATKQYNPAAMLRKSAAMDELDESDPIYNLLSQPNDFQSETDFWKLWLIWLKLTGFSPIYTNTGASGVKVLAISNLAPQWITITPNSSLTGAKELWYSPFGAVQATKLPLQDCYISRYQNPDYTSDGQHLYGLSPLKAALLDLKGSTEAKKAIAKMYENGGSKGVLMPKEVPMNQQQADLMRATIDTFINGNSNKGKEGAVSFPIDHIALGLDAVDMKLIEGGALTDQRIALAYNHPPALLQADNKYDNQLEAIKYLVTNSIYPDLVMKREFFNNWLLPIKFNRPDLVADFDITELPEMQEDMSKLVQSVKDAWWITPNEKRSVMKYDDMDMDEMNTIYIPTGLMPIGDAAIGDENLSITEDYSEPITDEPDIEEPKI
jgi:HK97 family phage portal protein